MKITKNLILERLKQLKHLFLTYKYLKIPYDNKIVYKNAYIIVNNDIKALNKNLISFNEVYYNLKDIKRFLYNNDINNNIINSLLMELNNYIVLFYKINNKMI